MLLFKTVAGSDHCYFLLQAKVDTNREQITFARPELEHLRIFCNEKFGWPFNKTDELMVPVLKVTSPRIIKPQRGHPSMRRTL